ncbi:MAG TPA: Fis family transcriptional regulator [Thermofilum sp.]|nr:Fis family transcriptional regulator [Thermofilum sp.]
MLKKELGLADIGDFDGIACAALFKIKYPRGVVVFASPRDVNNSILIRSVRWVFVGDLPCPGKVKIRADHHETNKPCAQMEFYSPDAPAAAVMAIKALGLTGNLKAEKIVACAVETDTANIKSEEARILNAATKGANYREKIKLAELLATKGIQAVNEEFVAELASKYFDVEHRTEMLAEKIPVSERVVIVFEKNIGISYRYLSILLNRRGADFTLILVPKGFFGIRAYFGARPGSSYNSAFLAKALGGGGHQYAAGAYVKAVPRSKAIFKILRLVKSELGLDMLSYIYIDKDGEHESRSL